ncbi:MAG: metal ABC transporter permease [Rickettsiales bacterium]
MLEPFIMRAIIAGVGIAIIAGVIGCFVVWRRMAYFGDSLAHSALLGVALGLATGINANIGTIIICSIFALLLLFLQQKKIMATDTLLGILAHSALSIGMVTISIIGHKINLHSYLFGDILTVTSQEIWLIYGGGIVVMAILLMNWSSMVLMTINEDLAKAENIRTFTVNILLMFIMTIVVAISIRVVGILLITSMLIIPAASARHMARSPESMAIISALLGVISVVGGMSFSIQFDTPSAPSIVATSAAIFIILLPCTAFITGKKQQ